MNVSLRFAMSLVLAGLLIFALLMSNSLLLRSQQDALSRLNERIINETSRSAQRSLSEFLAIPERGNALMKVVIESAEIPLSPDLAALERPMFDILTQTLTEHAALNSMAFANEKGEFIGLVRKPDQRDFFLVLKDRRTQHTFQAYPGTVVSTPSLIIEFYDPRTRPWYQLALERGKPVWSEIYNNAFNSTESLMSYATPLMNAKRQVTGVLVSNLQIHRFNQFLLQLPDLRNGAIFIVDEKNRLIAHSSNESVLQVQSSSVTKQVSRKLPSQSDLAVVRAAGRYLDQNLQRFDFLLDGEKIYGRILPLENQNGLNWRIVVLLPENDLIGTLKQEQRSVIILIFLGALGVMLLGWYFSGYISWPILQVAQAAENFGNAPMQNGWQPQDHRGWQLRETAQLTRSFNRMAQQLIQSFRLISNQMRLDEVTGLLSRDGLRTALENWHYSAEHKQLMLQIGLDGFRAINDSVGHTVGNMLLSSIAHRLQHSLPPDVLLARTAGTEFTMLFPKVDPTEMGDLVQFYRDSFVTAFSVASADEIVVPASVGALYGHFELTQFDDWLRNASIALGQAKARGHGSSAVFESEMLEQSIARTRLTNELKLALEREEFRVFFQPVIDLATGETIGAEALVRWQSPNGMVSPALFIPAAEESGLILPLGQWVLRDACRQIAEKIAQGWRTDFGLHVNVSVRQLIQSDFYEQVRMVLAETALPANGLTLEITESCLITQSEVIVSLVRRLRALGVSVAIDDFGTGYSSLAYLHQFDFDCLKIDQSFVARMLDNPQDQAIVSAIIDMAAGFDATLVAEGIETAAQADHLRAIGCQHAQGYFFGRPAPLEAWPQQPVRPDIQ
ncbi:EAL domain-containing protein [Chitinibacter sp. S2-10]|uniref:bifunctional diguanylate cyclase/phosphodiesterase n=1 Tax=Chitinibacter sp. S2-10 TaxID=3373597 RepID=UPI0039778792